MNAAIEMLVLGGVVPLLFSAVTTWLLLRRLPTPLAPRYAVAVAFAAGFILGYILLPAWAPLVPSRYWHWLPYLAGASAVLGPIAQARELFRGERALLMGLFVLSAAWLLTPDWPDWEPPRAVWVISLATYAWLLALLLPGVSSQVAGPWLLGLLVLVTFSSTLLIAFLVSLKLGQVAALSAASLAGCAVGIVGRGRAQAAQVARAARAAVPAYAVVVLGSVYGAVISIEPPAWRLLVVPALPLCLAITRWGPAAKWQGNRALLAQVAAVLGPLGLVAGWLLASH